MFARLSAIAITAALVSTASLAHAEDVPKKSCNKTTGIVLTTVGGSLILTAPLVVAIGAAAVSSNPYSYAAMGPVVLGAFGGAVIGLGMLIPGIVMVATSKPTKAQPASPRIEAKQPTWTELRPVGMNAPRVVGFPIFRGSF